MHDAARSMHLVNAAQQVEWLKGNNASRSENKRMHRREDMTFVPYKSIQKIRLAPRDRMCRCFAGDGRCSAIYWRGIAKHSDNGQDH